jgi:hypothetical protein
MTAQQSISQALTQLEQNLVFKNKMVICIDNLIKEVANDGTPTSS